MNFGFEVSSNPVLEPNILFREFKAGRGDFKKVLTLDQRFWSHVMGQLYRKF